MAPTSWTTGTVSSDGESIYYECTGDRGPTVVLCHGLGGNHAAWFQQVPALAKRFCVVTWDQRGFGRSSNRGGSSGPQASVSDLTAIFDRLGVDRAHVIAQSMGGWAALGFALRYPSRVASLVLADTTGGLANDKITDALVNTTRRNVPPSVAGAHPAIGERFRMEDPVKAFLYQQIGSFRGDVSDDDMIGKLFSTRYPVDEAARLDIPTLCIVGASDDLVPPAAVGEVAAILHARNVVEIDGAGHSPYFERPDAWNEAVLSFLAEVQAERGGTRDTTTV